jgi:molybdopterin synthase sulfur carrier subunit
MATIDFTPNLRRHVDCPAASLDAGTIREFLGAYFARWPDVRNYVLDDQGAVRHHVKVMIDGQNVRDRTGLTDRLGPDSRIHIFQALSGG